VQEDATGGFSMTEMYLTTRELEAKYKVSRATIKKWRDNGMPFCKISGTIRFRESEIENWIKDQNERKGV
jgi:predicted DNA-binding transcriptional regulator AlpA